MNVMTLITKFYNNNCEDKGRWWTEFIQSTMINDDEIEKTYRIYEIL